MKSRFIRGVTAACAVGALVIVQPTPAGAADHVEAPGSAADPAADITDYYAWHKGTGVEQRLVLVVDFAGLNAPIAGQTGTYDRDVLYVFHIDKDGDNQPDESIEARFGKNGAGQWGLRVSGLPGGASLEGPVGTTLEGDGGVKAWAGLRDDPFFFDLTGFQQTLATGTVAFDSSNDDFAGTNVTSIVIEIPSGDLGTSIQTWGETRRIKAGG